ncbi:MAG TPA: PEP-CTERM sorting domain-containing protein [Phycisphaerae bacterium]|nr:PEP-CTERM sorting domain-containing protein [Phycisphaerae bacterium]
MAHSQFSKNLLRRKMYLVAASLCAGYCLSAQPFALGQAYPVSNSISGSVDYSPPAILDYFGGSWTQIQNRMPDIFDAGYGTLQTPPPSRADSGNESVGYDVYNRLDLGSPNDPTLYGTQNEYESLIDAVHQMGGDVVTDFSLGHNGDSDYGTTDSNGNTFQEAGGYPGFVNTSGDSSNLGDFNNPDINSSENPETGQTNGLVNINFDTDNNYLREPTTVGNPNNLPAGTTPAFGRIANQAMPANQQFSPEQGYNPNYLYNPATGQSNIEVSQFNTSDPGAGSPTEENDTGYMMTVLQYYIQVLGVDGFRLDAVKNMEWPTMLPYYEQAVYHASPRTYLNGEQEVIFGYSEYENSTVPVDAPPNGIINMNPLSDFAANNGTVSGELNALAYQWYFNMDSNLSSNGYTNNWNNFVNQSLGNNDSGDGVDPPYSIYGVKFVSNQDEDAPPPYLSNVADAYTLMLPGDAIIYFNGETDVSGSFPYSGEENALGGAYGGMLADNTLNTYNAPTGGASYGTMTLKHTNQVSGLVDIRNRFSTGNYTQLYLSQNNYAFERDDDAIVLLNNQTGGGNYSTSLTTDFSSSNTPYLVELTGNAAANGLPQVLQVYSNGVVNVTFPNNDNSSGTFTGEGYLIYGPPTPIGKLTLTNVSGQIAGTVPNTSDSNIAYENGADTVSSVAVIKASSFQIQLQTENVELLGNLFDPYAGGNFAELKINGGLQLNGQTFVSTNPNNVSYGYIPFQNQSPLYPYANNNPDDPNGTGLYTETINTSDLPQGYDYLEAIAFRARNSGEPPVYTDWSMPIYVDTAPPVSEISSFSPVSVGTSGNYQLQIQSVDGLATSVYVLWNLPVEDTTSQILSLVSGSNETTQIDSNLFSINEDNLDSGNQVATVVTYKPDGTYNIQRFTGLYAVGTGLGLGDLNFDDQINETDVQLFGQLLADNNPSSPDYDPTYNPAADFDGTGNIDYQDLLDFGEELQYLGYASGSPTMQAYDQLLSEYSWAASNPTQPIPEPASLGLFFAGLVPLIFKRRKNSRK